MKIIKTLSCAVFSLFLIDSSWAYSVITVDDNPLKWGSSTVGTGAEVSWSLMSNGAGSNCFHDSCSPLDSWMPSGYVEEIERAFDAFAAVADLTFTYTVATGQGDIRLGAEAIDGVNGVLAHALGSYYTADYTWAQGEVHFDTAENWTIGSAGVDIFSVALHEIGHALGLGHSVVTDAVMKSTFNPAGSYGGLSADDIAGIQYLYGVSDLWVDPLETPLPSSAIFFASSLLLLATKRINKRKAQVD